MLTRRLVFATAIFLTAASPVAASGTTPTLPPVTVPGARSVYAQYPDGRMSHIVSINSASQFAHHGGSGKPCSFTAQTDGQTPDHQTYVRGQVIQSDIWIFMEGTPPAYDIPSLTHLGSGSGPINDAVRPFVVFCLDTNHPIDLIWVSAKDPVLNPHVRLTNLYNGLQLERPTIFRNPVVDEWGGLITRYPAWLAIGPSAWRPQTSNTLRYHGWFLSLVAVPKALDFSVKFTPDPAQPSRAFNGIVPCITGPQSPGADNASLPAMPLLPEQTEPGVNGPCMWTPPGPGHVTIQARITYQVTFWANAYTETQPDYVWTSAPVTFTTGELNAVNTNG